MQGKKYDQGKLRWSLVPWKALEKIVEVLMYGAEKYEEENWKKLEDPTRRYWEAAIRHLVLWQQGEKIDPESGKSHLAHVGANILFLLFFEGGANENKK
jgi:hypothetical protein